MFGHPYKPYDVQNSFMTALYSALTTHDVAIFESPTGTGKTLSLLCPSLAWLRNDAERQLQADLDAIDAGGGPQWARDAAKQVQRDAFLARKRKPEHDLPETEASAENGPKIYFASRTHSQLAQVAEALRKIKVVPAPQFVTLGSRKQLCIHPQVTKLSSVEQMNEKCADLVKNQQCEYRMNLGPLESQIETQIMDIEDLTKVGRQEHSCPYYATRNLLPSAEVVALPYPLLLVESNRAALHIDLQHSVVVIDEAHNLVDTLTALHSATLTMDVVERAQHGLSRYVEQVGGRLGPDNRRMIMQISKLAESLAHYFQCEKAKAARPGTPLSTSDLLAFGNAFMLNFVTLNTFALQTFLVHKVESYTKQAEKVEASTEKDAAPPRKSVGGPSNALGILLNFVVVATNPFYDGKLYHDIQIDEKTGVKSLALRYLVLDPAPLFKDVVDQTKCVVLAGGTMEPMSEFTTYLLPEQAQTAQYSYGHIVPKSQLLVVPLGPHKFTFANRDDRTVIRDLGQQMLKIVESTPHGVVVFFPGYSYLQQVVRAWQKPGPDGTAVYHKLRQLKRVFCETKASSSDIFAAYAKSVAGQGALLLAVVGGRLSEGINFSDDLARAVVMVGLPFPNAMSAEMVAKRRFIEQSSLNRGESAEEAKENARQYYENLAMRAVNQSVGRAIRHAQDYAAIYLIDARYTLPHVQSKLSKWIRDGISTGRTISDADVAEFWLSNQGGAQQK